VKKKRKRPTKRKQPKFKARGMKPKPRKRAAKSTAVQLTAEVAPLPPSPRPQDSKSIRLKDAERKRLSRAANKEVIIPACEDRARRERLEANDVDWLKYYFGPASGVRDPYTYEFTFQQLEMFEAFRFVMVHGGDQALAASRGEGKTTNLERMSIKYVLQGLLTYVVLLQATRDLAENSLDTIKTAFQDNPLLLADYPEVCVPVRALENTPNRAHYQLVTGNRHDNGAPFKMASDKFSWCGREIILPNVPGSPSAEAIIATRGLDAAIRGLKKKGRRPKLLAIDDPDTDTTTGNEKQTKKLESKIEKSLGGLGGQQQAAGRIMVTTIPDRISVSAVYTDPIQKPSWNGKRFRYLITPPKRKDLVDEYVMMRDQDFRDFNLGKTTDRHCRRSHAFWLAHRAEIESTAIVANPNRFDGSKLPDGSQVEVSALQHYYNEVARIGPEAVATELDNDPPADETQTRLALSAYHIQSNCASNLERRMIPDDAVAITTGVDIQKLGLHFVSIAWSEAPIGAIIDYDFHEFLTQGKKAADCELLILEGLFAWHEKMQEHAYLNAAGDEFLADLTLIDMGWKEESWNTQPVQLFCAQVGHAAFLPSKGVPNYRRPRDSSRVFIGDNWHISYPGGTPVVQMNSDHWKLKVHEGFLLDDGQPGSIRLFNSPRIDGRASRTFHLSYAKHILAETHETRLVAGFRAPKTGWWKSPKPNHYFDATYEAIAARSVRGINVLTSNQPASPNPAPSHATKTEDVSYQTDRNYW
jgi:hypothetical protein